MTRKDFTLLEDWAYHFYNTAFDEVALTTLAERIHYANPSFDKARFISAVTGKYKAKPIQVSKAKFIKLAREVEQIIDSENTGDEL